MSKPSNNMALQIHTICRLWVVLFPPTVKRLTVYCRANWSIAIPKAGINGLVRRGLYSTGSNWVSTSTNQMYSSKISPQEGACSEWPRCPPPHWCHWEPCPTHWDFPSVAHWRSSYQSKITLQTDQWGDRWLTWWTGLLVKAEGTFITLHKKCIGCWGPSQS